jgi:hypothetical protein
VVELPVLLRLGITIVVNIYLCFQCGYFMPVAFAGRDFYVVMMWSFGGFGGRHCYALRVVADHVHLSRMLALLADC